MSKVDQLLLNFRGHWSIFIDENTIKSYSFKSNNNAYKFLTNSFEKIQGDPFKLSGRGRGDFENSDCVLADPVYYILALSIEGCNVYFTFFNKTEKEKNKRRLKIRK